MPNHNQIKLHIKYIAISDGFGHSDWKIIYFINIYIYLLA